ncbi:MAG: methyltransferase domain-containing protein [Fuerstiella sp.]
MSDTNAYPTLLCRLWRYVILFLKRPAHVASLAPSSRFLARRICDMTQIELADCIIELGPGDGSITRRLLSEMPPIARVLAVELVAEMAEVLQAIDDDRLIVEHADAQALTTLRTKHGIDRADVIVSGIPFSNLDTEQAHQIMEAVFQALKPGGMFIAYQFRDQINGLAQQYFGEPEISFVPLNFPPLHVYRWTKRVVPTSEPQPVLSAT